MKLAALLLLRRTTISHFAFLISHSNETFKRKQGQEPLLNSLYSGILALSSLHFHIALPLEITYNLIRIYIAGIGEADAVSQRGFCC